MPCPWTAPLRCCGAVSGTSCLQGSDLTAEVTAACRAAKFEPTPARTGALSQRPRPLGQAVLLACHDAHHISQNDDGVAWAMTYAGQAEAGSAPRSRSVMTSWHLAAMQRPLMGGVQLHPHLAPCCVLSCDLACPLQFLQTQTPITTKHRQTPITDNHRQKPVTTNRRQRPITATPNHLMFSRVPRAQ